MKRIALFVEGHTEAEFIEKIFSEIAGFKNISIKQHQIVGGGQNGQTPVTIKLIAEQQQSGSIYEAWIYNCGNDQRICSDNVGVTSYIKELYPNLQKLNFDKIIGLRDLRGMQGTHVMTLADLPKIELAAKVISRYCSGIPTNIAIAVMEIETWFLAETNHYSNIHSKLTPDLITLNASTLGFNPYLDDLTLRTTPTEDLDSIYKLAASSLAYKKKKNQRTRVIKALDCANLYLVTKLRTDMVKLKELLDEIDTFL